MASRRRLVCALGAPSMALVACSVITSVPDLTGGAPDASADASAPDACPPHVFTYDPKGRSLASVHVAGSFNGWPKTIDAGGWPLAKSGATWSLVRALPRGKSTYKLVLNEQEWIADPSNPSRTPDGFGAENSVVDVPCGDGG